MSEIIAIASGKGGTGKTLIAVCLGYLLTRVGHRTLLVDADPATDGLSLFLLGPKGLKEVDRIRPENTFRGVLEGGTEGPGRFKPRTIYRTGEDDHALEYQALVSGGRAIYGDPEGRVTDYAVPRLSRAKFRSVIQGLFTRCKEIGPDNDPEKKFDYIVVDTRGGFSFESTDVCALADSFIVVTEADHTSFYQDRNLVDRIKAAAPKAGKRPLLRGIIVNKAIEGKEENFRHLLEKEFDIRFDDTYPLPWTSTP